MYYKIASILLNNEQKSGTAGDIFIAQPDNQKEALVGKLFILAEIQSTGSEAPKLLEFLIKNINFNYYQNEKVILKERIESISVESIFESALAKTNKDLAEFIAQEKIKISPYAFNLSICVLYKNEIYFAGTGKNKTLLIYKEKTALKQKGHSEPAMEKIEYKISDVGETAETEALNINKLLSNVVSGKIPVGGYFLVINEALSEYLSNKQLIRIITKLSPTGAAEQIRNLLEQINSYVSFLGIIVKNTVATNFSGEELKSRLEEEITVEDYKPEIVRTEEKTEEIMTPAGIVNLKKWTKAISEKIKPSPAPIAPRESKTSGGMFLLKEKIFFKKRGSLVSSEKTKDFFKKFGKLIGAFFTFIVKIIRRESDDDLPADDSALSAEKKPLVISGKKIKIILVVAVIFIAIFFVGLYFTNQRNQSDAKLRAFNALVASIGKNQDKIDADFVYGNKSEATELFNLDKDLLAQIPAAEVSKRQTVQALFDRQKQQLLKIQNINNVSGLNKIGDFSNLTAAAQPQNLFFANNTVYAADSQNSAIFKIDVKQNMVTAVYNLGIATSGPITFPSAGQDNNVFYLSGDNIFQLDKLNQPSLLTIGLPSTPENISGLLAYSDKMYVLDKSLNQIYRFTRNGNSFANPAKWLNQAGNLASSTGLYIDDNGNLYILYRNGQVEKYLKGKKQNLALDAVDPAITNATRLIVTADYFYVLEPSTKRLIIWNSKGAYLAQYIFTDLNDLKDFAINTADKQIYLLNGHSVYQLAVPVIK
ncbi:MAG TPA: hypothetical protein VMC41_01660 [Candidatus Nanoarchaeia archaeon]|nr:hypothetical protein [Candidatus Nanoarchaeia archaeon]